MIVVVTVVITVFCAIIAVKSWKENEDDRN